MRMVTAFFVLAFCFDVRAEQPNPFQKIGEVLRHPRCLNCHVAGDSPKQTDQRRIHSPPVKRGPDGGGVGMKCVNCHREKNGPVIPGAPHWRLAPATMAWENLNDRDLCRALLDRAKNGDRSPEQLLRHMMEDELVGWAWSPGGRRTTIPLSKEDFGQEVRAWIDAGTPCPDDSNSALWFRAHSRTLF